MGVLTIGEPMTWDEAAAHRAYVREHGVVQFVEHFQRYASLSHNSLMYGDEIEYGLFVMDAEKKTTRLSLRGAEVRTLLAEREVLEQGSSSGGKSTWHPEYGSWMVESTPAEPYSGFTSDLRRVEANMRARRARLLAALNENEIAPTVVVFPLLGVPGTSGEQEGAAPNMGPIAMSKYLPDAVINPHPRFGALTSSIRTRRGSNVNIEIPLFKDTATDFAKKSVIDMDAMAFGMGCCCLQVTFQCRDVDESRHVYDQLAVLAPIMLALTAATPVLKGELSDWDVRWEVIEKSVDDRTPAERGDGDMKADASMVGGGVRPISTSRYTSAQSYMCNDSRCAHCPAQLYNDKPLEMDETVKKALTEKGIDDLLASHVAHLFVRDPLVLFQGMVHEVDDEEATDHFENLQSTNWNSVRWKPPPADGGTGWRVELRTMEVQLTDFENAAYTVFSTLALRVLLSFDLDIYVPISKVHSNMDAARERDAVTKGRFWWRSQLAKPSAKKMQEAGKEEEECCAKAAAEKKSRCSAANCQQCEQMTLSEILLGKGHYVGLVSLIYAYLDVIGCDLETLTQVKSYIDLIVRRASGELMTAAKWMRTFIKEHPDYKKDSIVSPAVAHDLLVACDEIGLGKRGAPELLGEVSIKPIVKEDAYNVQLSRVHVQSGEDLCELLDKHTKRASIVQHRNDLVTSIRDKKQELADLQAELLKVEAQLSTEASPPGTTDRGLDRLRTDANSISVSLKSRKSDSNLVK